LKRLLAAACILAALIGVARAGCYLPWDARPDLRMQWLQTDCRYHFPPQDGFAGTSTTVLLTPGTVVDRFGYPTGRVPGTRGCLVHGTGGPVMTG
jgi:hypothetical protein